jgi:signal transduction histidine kinase/ActR/RegA family two-component response regulator
MIKTEFSKAFRRPIGVLRLHGPLAHDRTAEMFCALLVALVCLRLLYFPILLPFVVRKAAGAAVIASTLIIFVTALALLRRGSFQAASLIYLWGTWLVYTIAISLTAGIRSRAVVFYLVLPVSAAWLLGSKASLRTAAGCFACLIGFAALDHVGLPPPMHFRGAPFVIWGEMLSTVLSTTVPVARMIQVLQEALGRSRSAERQLQEYQSHLEELVRKRTKELVAARDQAQAASLAKSAFLANVSHELRSPLNTILLLSDADSVDANRPEERRQDLMLIHRSGERLLHLINDVLDTARIEAGRVVVENTLIDLREFIREISDLMQVRAEQKSLDLVIEQSAACPRLVRADAGKLRHILINLIDNAIKYTDTGTVTVLQGASPSDQDGRLQLKFEIVDTGIGIAPQDQQRIFEPFTRVGNVAARQGSGLGLAITRQYTEVMGGRLRIESALGTGSHFYVEVPVDIAPPSALLPAKIEPRRVAGLAPGQTEYRILVVEDRTEDRWVLRRILEDAGFRVQAAETGESGIEVFKDWQPHFIWMDRRLPVMDGLEAARTIRTLNGGHTVKMVGVSASALPAEREEMLAAGLDDFVRKPFLAADIFDCIARHLGVSYVYEAVWPRSGR